MPRAPKTSRLDPTPATTKLASSKPVTAKARPQRRERTFVAANPMALWMDLGAQTSEMMLASFQVIAHRTAQMMSAAIPPSSKDRDEFALMGAEKSEAILESVLAMSNNMFSLSPLAMTQAFRQIAVVQKDMLQLALSSSPSQVMSHGLKLNRSLTRAGNGASAMSGRAARLASDGLKPIHSRALANAKRLAKKDA